MNVFAFALMLAAFGQVAGEAPAVVPSQAHSGDPVFSPASITVEADKDVVISAEAEGTLISLPVREGERVADDQVLATIDDRHALAAQKVAEIGLAAARAKADDAVEETFAIASAKYAKIDLDKVRLANLQKRGAFADIEVEEKKLAYTRAGLQIEKAKKDREIASKEADVKAAELDAAGIQLEHRTVKAPFAGEIQELRQKQAQWVKPGDPILRLVQYDKLRVECFVRADEYDPVDLANRRVTVTAHLARGRTAAAEGRIVHIDQTVLSGVYRVRAEVQNQREGDFWLLRPGLNAEMKVHTSEPPVAVEAKTARQPE
jgi:multidrug efflux pump subunit AcrA (membrane-fusion protein)